MKFTNILPLVALTTAFVLPEEQVFSDLSAETQKAGKSLFDHIPSFDDIKHGFEDVVESSKNTLDEAIDSMLKVKNAAYEKAYEEKCDVDAWLSSDIFGGGEHPPHHGPPHHDPPHDEPPHHGPPHHGHPHHPPHHHKPNMTIYELISKSKYTTKLAALVANDTELVKVLNGTAANYTLFAPTDHAFEKLPDHHHTPSKELIRKVLLYHVSPDFYPAGRVLHSHTIPTLYNESGLGDDHQQRITRNIGLKGLTLNYYSRVVAVNIFGTNGVIHGIDSLLLPPPSITTILSILPAEFSTLTLGLTKTGLLPALNATTHRGATFFAPSNFAFRKLGPRVNAFLFSRMGEKYLKALLEYHVVLNHTLYSDAYYKPSAAAAVTSPEREQDHEHGPPLLHIDLPTLLADRSLSIDILRYGPFITIKINGFSRVAAADFVARDGVMHAVSNVLIPPKRLASGEEVAYDGGEMDVEEFKLRFDGVGAVEEAEGRKGLKLDL